MGSNPPVSLPLPGRSQRWSPDLPPHVRARWHHHHRRRSTVGCLASYLAALKGFLVSLSEDLVDFVGGFSGDVVFSWFDSIFRVVCKTV